MNPDDHLDVASGAIVPSSCGELAFRVIKKVCECEDLLRLRALDKLEPNEQTDGHTLAFLELLLSCRS